MENHDFGVSFSQRPMVMLRREKEIDVTLTVRCGLGRGLGAIANGPNLEAQAQAQAWGKSQAGVAMKDGFVTHVLWRKGLWPLQTN